MTTRTPIPVAVRWAVWERDDFRCVYCGSRSKRLTIDHIRALADGGTNDVANLQSLCGPCNTRKSTRAHHPGGYVLDPETLERVEATARKAADFKTARDTAIRAAYTRGATLREIAAAAGLSFTRIHQIVTKEKP